MDEFEYFISDENYDNESNESDSGISSGSSTISSSSFCDEPNDDMITNIVKEINSQNPVFIREMILFSINGILSKDTRLSSSALVFLWKLFKLTSNSDNSAVDKILINCPELISNIKVLIFDEKISNELQFYVSGIFYYSSKTQTGCKQILENSIDALQSMIKSESIPIIYYSFTCIHNILLNIFTSKEIFSKNFDLSPLVKQLVCSDEIFKSKLELVTLDILSRLAIENEIIKNLLFTKKILHKCVKTVMKSKTTKILIVNGQVIRVMSTDYDSKDYLMKNDEFIKFLIDECLQINETYTCRIFWSIILNLSDKLLLYVDENQMKISDLIKTMVKSIRNFQKIPISTEMIGLILCCLSNFSCHQEWVKDIIWKKGIQFTIVEFLKMEKKSNSVVFSVNAVEACYRCLNHIIDKISIKSSDFITKNYLQLVAILDYLKVKRNEDDLHHKLIRLSISEIKKMKSYSLEEFHSFITPIRSWAILMHHIVAIESGRNAKQKSVKKDYQIIMKSIQNEVEIVFNFLSNKCFMKHQVKSPQDEETFKDLMNHLNVLINVKYFV